MGSTVLVVQYIKHRSYKCNVPHRAVLKIEQNPGPWLPLKNKGETATGFFTRVGQVLKNCTETPFVFQAKYQSL
jgi:hypothetical protein